MSALLAALTLPGPQQQLIVSHLSLQERLNLAATCKELYDKSFGWTWEVPIIIDLCYTPDLEAITSWLQRHTGCGLLVQFSDVFSTLAEALGPLPPTSIVELHTSRVPDWQWLSSTATRLQRLHLSYAAATHLGAAVQSLARVTSLTQLHADGHYRAAADLAPLALLTQLGDLGISGATQDAVLDARSALSAMPLQHLSMQSCTEAGLVSLLPAVQALTSLDCHFDRPGEPDALWQQQLLQLTQLQNLQLNYSRLVAVPASLPPALTALAVRFQQVPLMQLHRLASLQRLRFLSLRGNDELGEMQAALVELPALPQLAALDLSVCELVAVPASVAAQTALTSLLLDFNRIQSGWEHLVPLTRLRALSIATHMTEVGEREGADDYLRIIPAAFSCLTSLTLLSLGGQHYVHGGWHHLQPLTQLQLLDLSSAHLPRMPRGLVALYSLPLLRIEVGDDTSFHWAQRFNQRGARLLQRHQQQEPAATQPATQALPQASWALRLLRRLAGACARPAATE